MFPFLSQVHTNEPPPGSSTGPLWREIPIYRAFVFLIKIPLNKKALRKKRPFMFTKSGVPMEADAQF